MIMKLSMRGINPTWCAIIQRFIIGSLLQNEYHNAYIWKIALVFRGSFGLQENAKINVEKIKATKQLSRSPESFVCFLTMGTHTFIVWFGTIATRGKQIEKVHDPLLKTLHKSMFQKIYKSFSFSDYVGPCDSSLSYDCGDNTCIDKSLECNGNFNCNFEFDEKGCEDTSPKESMFCKRICCY